MMDLETFLRANLDSAANGAGRPLAEYHLRVETVAGGKVLALHLHPDGFNAQGVTYGVQGSTLVEDAALAAQVQAVVDEESAKRKAFDDAHAAEVKRQREDQARLKAEEDARAAAEAEKSRPRDITKDVAP